VIVQHAEAVRTGAAERYVMGELSEQQALEYEEHFFDCRECAEEVKTAAAFADNARDAFRTETPAAETPAPIAKRRTGLGLFWPMPVGAAAAVLLAAGAAVYQASVVVPSLRRQVAQDGALQAAPWFFLSVSRAEPQVLTLSTGQRMVGLTLSRSSERSAPYYRCQVLDSAGRVVESAVVPGPREGGELQVLLPAARLQPGSHALELAPLQSPDGAPTEQGLVRYQFEVRRQEETR
jgi:hypothetical protein